MAKYKITETCLTLNCKNPIFGINDCQQVEKQRASPQTQLK